VRAESITKTSIQIKNWIKNHQDVINLALGVLTTIVAVMDF